MLPRALFGLAATAAMALGASLRQVTNFGINPTRINMHIYVPDRLAAKPAIIVALHPCGGNAQQFFSGTRLPSHADTNGFILIYPSTPNYSNCWDVNNAQSLTHNAGGDSQAIVAMVNHTLAQHPTADRSRVYAMGSSSGAMMTNVLAGAYPDVFEAGAAYSGTPHACFLGSTTPPTPFGANQTCAQGQIVKTPREWGDLVRNSFPGGYEGRRPRMMIVHGLADTLVRPACATEALKQWSDVLGLAGQQARNVNGVPSAAYTQVLYGDDDGKTLVGYLGQGVGHVAPVNEVVMLRFFGLIS